MLLLTMDLLEQSVTLIVATHTVWQSLFERVQASLSEEKHKNTNTAS